MATYRRQKKGKHVQEETIDSNDSNMESESEDISEDSDDEIQKAFMRKEIKPGLNYETRAPKKHINDEVKLKEKLSDIQLNLDWIERLDVTCDGTKRLLGQDEDPDELVHDDYKREMGFYRQAQQAVLEALPKLHAIGVATKRPEDYFAEMAKSDQHMRKIRERLIGKQLSIERSEKAKKLRELRKFGKKVQHEVLLQRQREKKQLMESVKQYKKGNKESLDALLGGSSGKNKVGQKGDVAKRKSQKDVKRRGPGKKRQYKDSKWGRGGKKDKRNTQESVSGNKRDGFNFKRNHAEVFKARGKMAPGKKGKKGKERMRRPGKNQRHKLKSRRK